MLHLQGCGRAGPGAEACCLRGNLLDRPVVIKNYPQDSHLVTFLITLALTNTFTEIFTYKIWSHIFVLKVKVTSS